MAAIKKTKKKTKRKLIPKTRCAGTLSEAGFWSFIRSALRQKSRWWKPVSLCKANAKRVYKGPKKRQKFEYQCNHCKKWFPGKQISVDHIIPAGSLNSSDDLKGFVDRLFCEVEGLQCLCDECHTIKTNDEKAKNKKARLNEKNST